MKLKWRIHMKNLLKLEFRKLRKQKSFYICTIVMVVLLFLSAMTSKALCDASSEFAAQYNGSGITAMIGAISNCSFLLIAGIFVALFVCDDYEQQIIKNIYSRGYSRSQVYGSKFISSFVATTIMFVIVVLSAFLFGTIYFGLGESEGTNIFSILAVQYLNCMANISLYFAISCVLRKTGSSVAGVFVAPLLVNMVLGLADSFLKLEKVTLASIWVSSFINDLSVLTIEHNRFMIALLMSFIYIPLFVAAGLYFHKKMEL